MILLQAANKTIAELKCQVKGQIIPISQEMEEEKESLINDLKTELEANKREEEERTKEMELRIKQLIIELSYEKE